MAHLTVEDGTLTLFLRPLPLADRQWWLVATNLKNANISSWGLRNLHLSPVHPAIRQRSSIASALSSKSGNLTTNWLRCQRMCVDTVATNRQRSSTLYLCWHLSPPHPTWSPHFFYTDSGSDRDLCVRSLLQYNWRQLYSSIQMHQNNSTIHALETLSQLLFPKDINLEITLLLGCMWIHLECLAVRLGMEWLFLFGFTFAFEAKKKLANVHRNVTWKVVTLCLIKFMQINS